MKTNLLQLFSFFILFFCENLVSQTLQELEKLKKEYKNVLDRQSLQKSPDIQEAESRASSTAIPDKLVYSRKDVESLLVNTQKLLQELEFIKDSSDNMKYIGYEFFTKRDSMPFWQNLPIPIDYSLGPGDEIIISVWGEVDLLVSETINRQGQIYIENIGLLYLGDKTLSAAKNYVFKRFSKIYSTLSGDNPKTYLDLSIGELKSLNVHFVGYVNMPGIHMVHPFSNVLSSLVQAGGVSNKGSLRDIQLIRNNKLIANIDLYDYIFYADASSDLRLLDQDVIYIPPRKSTIAVTGYIPNPGYFEAVENESLEKIINVSGGLNFKSYKEAFLYRRNYYENKSYVISSDNFKNFALSDGDSISIINNIDLINYVQAGGQIKNPGIYPFQEGMRIDDLITYSQSKKDPEFFKTIDLSDITINRRNINSDKPTRIKTNIEENLILKKNDIINFGAIKYYKKLNIVNITGEVMNPGLYTLNDYTTLQELLDLSGGYTQNALENGIEIFRDSLKVGWENKKFFLKGNDSLNVLAKSGLIYIKGQVNSPGFISYNKNHSMKRYIDLSGGLNSFADQKSIFIIYPNGTSKPYRRWNPPKVLESSTIVVNERLISSSHQRPSGIESFSAIASQAGSVATTILSLVIISNQVNGQ